MEISKWDTRVPFPSFVLFADSSPCYLLFRGGELIVVHLFFSGTCFLKSAVTGTIITCELENGKLLCLCVSVLNQDSGMKPANSKLN